MHSSNNSKKKVKVPRLVAHEFTVTVGDVVRSHGHDFRVFMRRIRARFNNATNYFKVMQIIACLRSHG